ncbi:MAG: SMC-Scp complex subunit ScpB [Parcubacteria group bacterium]|nr:SMC-Scp complex subunit ScpB [Parcubacteria group bacterium]
MSDDILQKLEALLFASGEPVERATLRTLLECTDDDLTLAFKELTEVLNGRGVSLIITDTTAALVTAAAYRDLIHSFFTHEQEERLSDAALETLAIIGYRGPIRASELSEIRGVDSNVVLRRLRIRGLVVRNDKTGTYQVSADFLRHMGIASSRELPKYEELHNLVIKEEPQG